VNCWETPESWPQERRRNVQDILRKKIDGIHGIPDEEGQARARLVKLFDAPLLEDSIEAIEDLLKVEKLGDKPSAPVSNKSVARVSTGLIMFGRGPTARVAVVSVS
jgi:hypothetical protein